MNNFNDTDELLKSKLGLDSYQYITPLPIKPDISTEDYENGFVERNFVSNINYDNVIETDGYSFSGSSSGFFKKQSIQWKISGPKNNVYENKILKFEGVHEYNTKTINELEKTFPDIKKILKNTLEFWRGY